MKRSRSSRRRGLTLIEIMIVFIILSILVLILLPNFVRAKARARLSGCVSNVKNLATSIELYSRENNDTYPTALTLLTPNYLKVIPRCPSAIDNTSYTSGYSQSVTPRAFTQTCQGSQHSEMGVPDNYPRFVPDVGLQER